MAIWQPSITRLDSSRPVVAFGSVSVQPDEFRNGVEEQVVEGQEVVPKHTLEGTPESELHTARNILTSKIQKLWLGLKEIDDELALRSEARDAKKAMSAARKKSYVRARRRAKAAVKAKAKAQEAINTDDDGEEGDEAARDFQEYTPYQITFLERCLASVREE